MTSETPHHSYHCSTSTPRQGSAATLLGHRRSTPLTETRCRSTSSSTTTTTISALPQAPPGSSPQWSSPRPFSSSASTAAAADSSSAAHLLPRTSSPRTRLFLPETPRDGGSWGWRPATTCTTFPPTTARRRRRLLLGTVVPALVYLGMTVVLQVSVYSREIWTVTTTITTTGSSASCEVAADLVWCAGLLLKAGTLTTPAGSNRTQLEDNGRVREKFRHSVAQPSADIDQRRRARPNYGGLRYSRPKPTNTRTSTSPNASSSLDSHSHSMFGRIIRADDAARYHDERSDYLAYIDSRHRVKAKYDHFADLDWPPSDGCRRANTTYTSRPTCNALHERSMGGTDRGEQEAAHYLGRGYYRTSWSIVDLFDGGKVVSDVVLKNQRYRPENEFDAKQFAQIHVEALSMERTTASDRTTDIYGHCGTSILVERAYPIESTLIEDYDFPDPKQVDAGGGHGDVRPRNHLTPPQKLAVALAMAEGLAWLHGNYDGVIVNDDIQISQWLLGRDGKVKLNDFNKAVIMPWNEHNQSYCPFFSEYVHQYRSPEELRGNRPVDESADVFSFGQTLYTLLTGLVPFYERGTREEALKANKYGDVPYVDPRYRNRSLIEGRLVDVMEPCYRYRPQDRTSIFQVVEHLRETVRLYEGTSPNATRISDVPLWDLKEYGSR